MELFIGEAIDNLVDGRHYEEVLTTDKCICWRKVNVVLKDVVNNLMGKYFSLSSLFRRLLFVRQIIYLRANSIIIFSLKGKIIC